MKIKTQHLNSYLNLIWILCQLNFGLWYHLYPKTNDKHRQYPLHPIHKFRIEKWRLLVYTLSFWVPKEVQLTPSSWINGVFWADSQTASEDKTCPPFANLVILADRLMTFPRYAMNPVVGCGVDFAGPCSIPVFSLSPLTSFGCTLPEVSTEWTDSLSQSGWWSNPEGLH